MASLPRPHSGRVVGYSYLWEAEFRAGIEEGAKDRPCAVVIATRTEDGDLVVTVAPITHSPPMNVQHGVELPPSFMRQVFERLATLRTARRTRVVHRPE